MFILSTSWNAKRHGNGFDMAREIREAGFDTVELGFMMTERSVDDIFLLKKEGAISVSSLHNMCPLPPEISPDKASPDFYSIASINEEERRLAVKIAKRTIDRAAEFGARAVVLHAGRVQIKDRTRELAGLIDKKTEFRRVKEEIIRERAEKGPDHLRNSITSLEELVPYSVKKGIALSIENRYYYREIPLFDEMKKIFGHFRESELYYWHDVGHAEVFERLGFARHRDLLDSFANRLIGVHLHDIIGVMNDHKAPGAGTFDFKLIRPYIGKDTLKVIEAHGPVTAGELRKSAEFLEKVLERG